MSAPPARARLVRCRSRMARGARASASSTAPRSSRTSRRSTEFEPDLAIGTTPVVQKAKAAGDPGALFHQPDLGASADGRRPAPARWRRSINAAIANKARFDAMTRVLRRCRRGPHRRHLAERAGRPHPSFREKHSRKAAARRPASARPRRSVLMLILDHDRAGGYWGAVYVFTAIKGLQVIIDGPVGCENLPVTSVLHYTDALPPHELPIVVTGLAEEELGQQRHRGRDEAGARDARSGPAGRRGHRLDRRDDRRRRDARRHQHRALPAAHDRRGPVAERRPRDVLAVERISARRRCPSAKPRKEGEKPRVNIIGPIYGTFNMPSDLAEIRRLVEGIGAEINMVFPLGSHLADVPQARRRRCQRLHVPRIRPPAVRGARAALSAGADRPALDHASSCASSANCSGSIPSRSSSARSTRRSSRCGICGARSRRISSARRASASSPTRPMRAACAISSKTRWACRAPSPFARTAGVKTDNEAIRKAVHEQAAAGPVRQLQRAHVSRPRSAAARSTSRRPSPAR